MNSKLYIKKSIEYTIQLLGIVGGLLCIPGIGLMIIFLGDHFINIYPLLGLIVIVSVIIFALIGMEKFGNFIRNTGNILTENTRDLKTFLKRKNKSIATIESILRKIEFIHKYIQKIAPIYKNRKYIFDKASITKITEIMSSTILTISESMYELKLELTNLVNKQQEKLKQAHSEVAKNITGTIELEAISELQKSRLDDQIEQFEELQKVLVKM